VVVSEQAEPDTDLQCRTMIRATALRYWPYNGGIRPDYFGYPSPYSGGGP